MRKEEGVNKKMEESWNDKAKENAYHWVDSRELEWDKASYYEAGGKEVDKKLIEPLMGLGIDFDKSRSSTVLDIGCGTGRLVRALSKKAEFVHGLDISEKMLQIAKQDNTDLKNVRFELGDGISLDKYNSEYFDFVFSFIVFQHIPSKSVILSYFDEIYRVLKKDGVARFQVRGYPGRLRKGQPPFTFYGFNSFYIGIELKRSVFPVPTIRSYSTVFGAFFKPKEVQHELKKRGYKILDISYDEQDIRYLWITAKK